MTKNKHIVSLNIPFGGYGPTMTCSGEHDMCGRAGDKCWGEMFCPCKKSERCCAFWDRCTGPKGG